MADVATLGIRVDYGDVRQANDAINKLTRSATGATSALKLLAVAYVGYEALKSLVKVADAYTAMQSQIKLVTETTRELIYVQDQLNAVANNTYASMSETTNLFTAMEPTMRNLGRSTGESMRFIETFNKALSLTAPTASESQSAITQFLQAMGSGVLRGEEFSTIMENGRGVAMALADGLKVPIGALRSMAEEGELTADVVVQALESQRQAVDDKFGKMTMTVSQSSQIWSNEWMMFVGSVDKSMQGTEWLSNAIKSLATDLGTVTAFINDWGNASRAADLAVKDAADSASLFADSISTGDLLREVAGALYSLSDTFNYLSSSASFALKVLNTKIDTDTIDNLSEHYERYMLDLDILAKKKEVFISSLNKSKQAIADQTAEMKKLNLTATEYSSQAGMLYAQTAGFGTQTEILLEQERSFGNTLIDVTRIVTTYGIETNTAMKFSEKGKDIIGKLQEQYAMLGMSVRDAAVAKAVFDAQNKGATSEEIAYIKDMAGRVYDLTEAKKLATTASKAHSVSVKAESKLIDEQKESLEKLKKELDDASDIIRKLTGMDLSESSRNVMELDQAFKKMTDNGLASTQDYIDAVYRMDSMEFEGLTKATVKASDDVDQMTESAKNSLKRLDDAFADVWVDIFNGAEDFGSSLQRWFTQLLAELAHQAITKPIVMQFTQAVGLGSSGVGGSMSGDSLLSNAYNAYSTGSMLSTAGSILSGGSTMLSYGASMAGIGSATSQGAMLAAQTGSFGVQGAALTGQALGTASTTGSVMGTLSSAMPYVAAFFALDAALGSKITSGIVTGITGGDWELKSVTAKLDVLEGAIDSSIMQIERKDGGWFNKSKSRTKDLATTELDQAMQDAYSQIYSGVSDLSKRLGYQVAEDFTASVSVSVKGKSSQEVMAAFDGMMTDIGNQLVASASGLTEAIALLGVSGESAFQTLSRLMGQFDGFNALANGLNDSLATLNMTSIGAVDSLTKIAGGIQNLNAMQANFINTFYTDAQKAELNASSVSSVFDSLNLSIPETESDLINLVKSLDLTTEAGRNAYVALIGSTQALKEYYSNIESTIQKYSDAKDVLIDAKDVLIDALQALKDYSAEMLSQINNIRLQAVSERDDAINNLADSRSAIADYANDLTDQMRKLTDDIASGFKRLSNSLNDYLESIRIDQYANTGVKTNQYRSTFDQTVAAAMAGDMDAANRLTEVSAQLLENIYASAQTYEDYLLEKATIASKLGAVQAMADAKASAISTDANLSASEQLAKVQEEYELLTQKVAGTGDSLTDIMRDFDRTETEVIRLTQALSKSKTSLANAQSQFDYVQADLATKNLTLIQQYDDLTAKLAEYQSQTANIDFGLLGDKVSTFGQLLDQLNSALAGYSTAQTIVNNITNTQTTTAVTDTASLIAKYAPGWTATSSQLAFWDSTISSIGLSAAISQFLNPTDPNASRIPYLTSGYDSGGYVSAVGGYTGDGGKYDPAGIVHKGEYVVPAWQVDKYPQAISELEGIRKRGYASGGGVDLAIPMPNDSQSSNSDDFSAIIAELQALRAELAEIKAQDKQIGFQTIKYQKNVSDTVDKWDVNGMPINTEIELTV